MILPFLRNLFSWANLLNEKDRSEIINLISKIEKNEEGFGVPADDNNRAKCYEKLKVLLCLTISELETKNDATRKGFLEGLVEALKHCGGGWMKEVKDKYVELASDGLAGVPPINLPEAVATAIGANREVIYLSNLAQHVGEKLKYKYPVANLPHFENALKEIIGEEIGVPLNRVEEFDDVFDKTKELRKKFGAANLQHRFLLLNRERIIDNICDNFLKQGWDNEVVNNIFQKHLLKWMYTHPDLVIIDGKGLRSEEGLYQLLCLHKKLEETKKLNDEESEQYEELMDTICGEQSLDEYFFEKFITKGEDDSYTKISREMAVNLAIASGFIPRKLMDLDPEKEEDLKKQGVL